MRYHIYSDYSVRGKKCAAYAYIVAIQDEKGFRLHDVYANYLPFCFYSHIGEMISTTFAFRHIPDNSKVHIHTDQKHLRHHIDCHKRRKKSRPYGFLANQMSRMDNIKISFNNRANGNFLYDMCHNMAYKLTAGQKLSSGYYKNLSNYFRNQYARQS